jgi:hypothetical protein
MEEKRERRKRGLGKQRDGEREREREGKVFFCFECVWVSVWVSKTEVKQK